MKIKHIQGLALIIEKLGMYWLPEPPRVEVDVAYTGTGMRLLIYNNSGSTLYWNYKGQTEEATGLINTFAAQIKAQSTNPYNVLIAYNVIEQQVNVYETDYAVVPGELLLSSNEILISRFQVPATGSNVTIGETVTVKDKISKTAMFWFNTLNEQTAGYLFNNDANTETKLLLRVDGDSSKTYKLTKANFYYIDLKNQTVTTPVIQIRKNTTVITSNKAIASGDNNLMSVITSSLNSFVNGDYINIYVVTGSGTSGGSEIYGYFSYVLEEK